MIDDVGRLTSGEIITDDELHLEGAPTDDQKSRLEDYLSELMLISAKYGILLIDRIEALEFLDVDNGNMIGLGLGVFTAPDDDEKITGYCAVDSILDGVWLVDSDTGAVEQRTVQNVFPQRDAPE